MKCNKRACLLAFMLVVLSLPYSRAQVDYAEEKTLIAQIKRDPAYIYGEGVAGNPADALEMAAEEFCSELIRVAEETGTIQVTGQIDMQSIRNNALKVSLKRGANERIFIYAAIQNIRQDADVVKVLPVEMKEEEPEEYPEIVEPAIPEETIIPDEPDEIIIEETPEESFPVIEVSSPLLRQILSVRSTQEMQKLFQDLKADRKIMWGNVNSNINDGWYLLVVDAQHVKAILDKGPGMRLNLLTGEEVPLSRYANDPKIWFLIYE